MEQQKKTKALQVRLPDDVYEALQYDASSTARTMNAVVIDSLRMNLPFVQRYDNAILRPGSGFSPTMTDALTNLAEYQKNIQKMISCLSRLIDIHTSQTILSIEIYKLIQCVEKTSHNGDALNTFVLPQIQENEKLKKNAVQALRSAARYKAESNRDWTQLTAILSHLSSKGIG